MRSRRNGVCGLLLLLAVSLVARPLPAAEEDYTDGIGHLNKMRWSLAAESFKKFLTENPKDKNAEPAQYYLGLCLFNQDDHKQARVELRSFVANYPRSKDAADAQYYLGLCSYLLRDNEAAATELAAFIDRAPTNPKVEPALAYLGETEVELNRPEQAVKHLQAVIDKNPKGPLVEDCQYFLARAYDMLNKPAESRLLYETLASSPTSRRAADAVLKLGKLEFDAGQYQKAAEIYASVEKRFPKSDKILSARLNLGFSLYQAGQYPQAIDAFDKVLADPRYADNALYWKGQSLRATADWAQAAVTFQAGYEKAKGSPAGERHLYQWANTVQRQGDLAGAGKLYLQLVDVYPKGALADESLHAACEVALQEGKPEIVQTLLARFDQQFPNSPLTLSQEILKGRLAVSSAAAGSEGDAKRDEGVKILEAAVVAGGKAAAALEARYRLGWALQLRATQPGRPAESVLQDHQKVLEVTAPVADALEKDTALRNLAEVYVLRGVSAVMLGKKTPADMMTQQAQHYTTAIQSANRYLTLVEKGEQADKALAVKVIAEARLTQKEAALADLERLKKAAPNSAVLDEAMLDLAFVAASAEPPLAERLYAELATRPAPRLNPRVLLDLAYVQARLKKPQEAAQAAGRLVDEYPDHPDAAEAGCVEGQMLESLDKLPEALKVYQAVFAKYAPQPSAYFAGHASAVVLSRLQRPEESDKAFEATAAKYPNRADLDRLLMLWATMNYDYDRYARGDEIYRKLIAQFPESKYADDARMSLAESDLLANRIQEAEDQFTALSIDPKVESAIQERALYQLVIVAYELAGTEKLAAEESLKRWDVVRTRCRTLSSRFPVGVYHWDADFYAAEADYKTEKFAEAIEKLVKLRESLLADRANRAAAVDPGAKGSPATADIGNGALPDDDPAGKPWYANVWLMLADSHTRLKQYAEVEATVAQFRQLVPRSNQQYQLDEVLGRCLKQQARFEEARKVLESVCTDEFGRRTETAAKCQFLIADTYLLQKDYKHAISEYLKVEIRYKFPEWQGNALFQAASCYQDIQDVKNAIKTYQDLITSFPEHAQVPEARKRLAQLKGPN